MGTSLRFFIGGGGWTVGAIPQAIPMLTEWLHVNPLAHLFDIIHHSHAATIIHHGSLRTPVTAAALTVATHASAATIIAQEHNRSPMAQDHLS